MRPELEVADIFRTAGPAYRSEQRGHLGLAQLKVMSAIEHCRSRALRFLPRDEVADAVQFDVLGAGNELGQTAPVPDREQWVVGAGWAVLGGRNRRMEDDRPFAWQWHDAEQPEPRE